MPEIITKYPETALKILDESGMECATGATQQILTSCPPNRFCTSSVGEICVYGLDEIPQMTQVSTQEIAEVVSAPIISAETLIMITVALALGVILGLTLSKVMAKKS
jgi:hypothetical protein